MIIAEPGAAGRVTSLGHWFSSDFSKAKSRGEKLQNKN
jgi:hypothetical protein